MAMPPLRESADFIPITGNKCKFLRPTPSLQLAFHCQRLESGFQLLRMYQNQRTSRSSVRTVNAEIVQSHPLIDIVRMSDIERFVGALDDVKPEGHTHSMRTGPSTSP